MRRAACAARRVLWASRACGWTNPHGAGKMDKMDQGKMDLSLDVLGLRVLSLASAHAHARPPLHARRLPAVPARDAASRVLCAGCKATSPIPIFLSHFKRNIENRSSEPRC